MGTSSSLSLLLLQRVYLKNACVVRELQCVTSSLEWGAAGKSGERILFSWIWTPHLSFYIDDAAILSSFCFKLSTFSVFFHLFKLFYPSYSTAFQPFQIFIFLPFQLLQTFRFMFSYENVKLFKLFQPYPTFLYICAVNTVLAQR